MFSPILCVDTVVTFILETWEGGGEVLSMTDGREQREAAAPPAETEIAVLKTRIDALQNELREKGREIRWHTSLRDSRS
jgi:hypothetical protein